MPKSRGISSFEATYQQLAIAWIDEQIAEITRHLVSGSSLLKGEAEGTDGIALDYARSVHRIAALNDVRAQLIHIENELSGA